MVCLAKCRRDACGTMVGTARYQVTTNLSRDFTSGAGQASGAHKFSY